jgi:hypothetical protein
MMLERRAPLGPSTWRDEEAARERWMDVYPGPRSNRARTTAARTTCTRTC